MKKKPKLTLSIKGIEWDFLVQTESTYNRQHGRGSEGITYIHERQVFFNSTCFSPYVVRHELFHCMIASCSTSSSSLSADQMEELCSEIYGEHATELDIMTEKILNYFLR